MRLGDAISTRVQNTMPNIVIRVRCIFQEV